MWLYKLTMRIVSKTRLINQSLSFTKLVSIGDSKREYPSHMSITTYYRHSLPYLSEIGKPRERERDCTALSHPPPSYHNTAYQKLTALGPECSQHSDQRQAGATLGGRRVVSGLVGSPCLLRYRIPSGTPGRCAASQGSPDVRGVSRTTRGDP